MDNHFYDAAGNLLNDGRHSYTYDANGHILKVDGGSTAVYVYDAQGRRIESNFGTRQMDFVYHPSGAVLDEWQNYPGGYTGWYTNYVHLNGHLFVVYTCGTTYFVSKDHLGSTRLLTDISGNNVECDDYLPFGEQLSYSGCSNTATTHKFTGKERDAETGLDNFGARYNSSTLGRFMSPDEASFSSPLNPQSWNLYAYVNNNPLSLTDPTGHEPHTRQENLTYQHGSDLDPFDQFLNAGDSSAAAETQASCWGCVAAAYMLGSSDPPPTTDTSPRLGIGIEVPSSSAVADGVLNVAADQGHTFVYLKDASGKIVSMLSFGPRAGIGDLETANTFLHGGLAGDVHWSLSGKIRTFLRRNSSLE